MTAELKNERENFLCLGDLVAEQAALGWHESCL